MDSYPALYQLANDPNSTIAQNWSRNTWNLLFGRNMNDWEPENIFETLANSPANEEATDRNRWEGCGPCSYTAMAGYRHLCKQNEIIDSWPWKLIWNTKLPQKLSASHGQLSEKPVCRRKFQLVNRCYMCNQNSEYVNHLFLHCPVATDMC